MPGQNGSTASLNFNSAPVNSRSFQDVKYEPILDYENIELSETVVNTKRMISSKNSDKISNANTTSLRGNLLAWTSMACAVLSGSSIGPIFKYMEESGIQPCLAASWRCQSMFLFLLPLALAESYFFKEFRVDWFGYKPDLVFPVFVHTIFSGLAWSGNLLFWIVGLQYTSTFRASLIANLHPLLLVIGLRWQGQYISLLEYFGTFVSIFGLVTIGLQDAAKEADTVQTMKNSVSIENELFGFFLCFLAAACEVMVVFNRIRTKQYVPLMQYTASTTLTVAIMASISAMVLGNYFHTDDHHQLSYPTNSSEFTAATILLNQTEIMRSAYSNVDSTSTIVNNTNFGYFQFHIRNLLQSWITTDPSIYSEQRIVRNLFENSASNASISYNSHVKIFCDDDHCIFGWTNVKWLYLVSSFGLMVGVVTIAGFNYALQYISPLVFSSITLVDPAITAILAWSIGVESLPKIYTWLGGFVVMSGVGLISYGEHIRRHNEHPTVAAPDQFVSKVDILKLKNESSSSKLNVKVKRKNILSFSITNSINRMVMENKEIHLNSHSNRNHNLEEGNSTEMERIIDDHAILPIESSSKDDENHRFLTS